MTADLSHLDSLQTRLSHERVRHANAETNGERLWRAVWVAQLEREVAREREFLGLSAATATVDAMSDDELLRELGA